MLMKSKRPGTGKSKRRQPSSARMFPVKTIGKSPAPDCEVSVEASKGGAATWHVPEETPVAFVYNRRNYAVMLATPQDLIDYAVGFSLTERVIDSASDILSLDISNSSRGVDLRLRISDEHLERFDLRQRRRNLPGNAGCGVCGLENADEFFTPLPQVAERKISLNRAAVTKAFDKLSDHQPLNQKHEVFMALHGSVWMATFSSCVRTSADTTRSTNFSAD